MERLVERTVYAAGDLVDFIACAHLAELNGRVADRTLQRPSPTEEDLLVARKGDAHEAGHLARLQAAGVTVAEIPRASSLEARRGAAAATLAAMRAGARAIHNATFVELPAVGDGWNGIADFLVRVEGTSLLGDFHYEVWDAKLARSAQPAAVVQMCVYTDLLVALQGTVPARMHLILGDGRFESFCARDVMPYYRAAKARFLARNTAQAPPYPEPVAYCSRCRWRDACSQRRTSDDHLSLVAHLGRSQRVKLHAGGISTAAALAAAPDAACPRKLERTTFRRLRAQALLQVEARATGVARYELLAPEERCGFARLPAPHSGDLYFDMEGDPFYDGGPLEYLFGVAEGAAGTPRYTSFAGHDRAGEKLAFERFVDFVVERRARHPELHVYHYASYEVSALRRLATQHATREDEVDTLLREGVLVDLYDVVRQSLRASFDSYSLKKIEQLYRGPRREEVTHAMGSVVTYERFLESRDEAEFTEILAYNREDCFSTLELHAWLVERKAELERDRNSAIAWRPNVEARAVDDDLELEGVAAELADGVEPDSTDEDERAKWLAAQLLVYHRREAKPAWWAFFDRLERKTGEELVDDPDAIGDLTVLGDSPQPFKQSHIHTLTFPPQEHKLKCGRVFDPAIGKTRAAGTLVEVDSGRGIVRLQRGPSLAGAPLPRALCPPGPVQNAAQRGALLRFARVLQRDGCRTQYRAARDLLYAHAPRLTGRATGAVLDDGDVTPAKLAALVAALDASYLFVQGPPGSGKTWTGARAIVDLLRRGLRVGIAATSHKAIHNLLGEVERVALDGGVAFRGYKKSASAETEYVSSAGAVRNTTETWSCANDRSAQLIAGTAWLFADAQMDASLDVLVVDEAGQVSLADAIAMSTSARSLLLLGDPMQLAQVAAAQHPGNAGASVLAHLLGNRATVPPERGIFLPHSFRMHPAICSFVSSLAYDGRLLADLSCENRRIDAGSICGAGLRYLPVAHEGNVQASPEEAYAIIDAIDELTCGEVSDECGRSRKLTEHDILVVTPYNANVRRIRETLDSRGRCDVRVGTVDKFQGQQAAVVFYSLAASRGDEIPRGIDFLFDRHRLNVAISRAQALVVLVCAPALLETPANSVGALVTIGALCRLAEIAAPLRSTAYVEPRQLSLIG